LSARRRAFNLAGKSDREMEEPETIKTRIKRMMVEDLMLQITEAEIGDDQPLFGQDSLGLDSVDALQLVVALDKSFGLKIPDPATARDVLHSVNKMAAAVMQLENGSASEV
jgi:acyl carrier protein